MENKMCAPLSMDYGICQEKCVKGFFIRLKDYFQLVLWWFCGIKNYKGEKRNEKEKSQFNQYGM